MVPPDPSAGMPEEDSLAAHWRLSSREACGAVRISVGLVFPNTAVHLTIKVSVGLRVQELRYRQGVNGIKP